MKISNEFEVARPVDTVWEFFQDVPSVAQCLPGAELTDDKGDGVYAGSVSVKLGPMSAMFEGEATVTPDPAAKSARISGKGVDRRGGSRGQVKVDYRLDAVDSGTRVTAGEVKGISLFLASLVSWMARFFKRLFGRQ